MRVRRAWPGLVPVRSASATSAYASAPPSCHASFPHRVLTMVPSGLAEGWPGEISLPTTATRLTGPRRGAPPSRFWIPLGSSARGVPLARCYAASMECVLSPLNVVWRLMAAWVLASPDRRWALMASRVLSPSVR